MLDLEQAKLEKHSVSIAGHRTSISLERGFWRHLRRFAAIDGVSLAQLIRTLDEARGGSLSGAIRAFVLQRLENELLSARNTNANATDQEDGAD